MGQPEITYVTGEAELLDRVGPLWEELNRHHQRLSRHFAACFEGRTFAGRRAGLAEKAATGHLRIDLARVAGADVGYCISSIDAKGAGEVESIYIEPAYRGCNIGGEFMRRALAWMDERDVRERYVVVAAGNEQALGFYERFGFHPWNTRLKWK